jgi:hypothetical protein
LEGSAEYEIRDDMSDLQITLTASTSTSTRRREERQEEAGDGGEGREEICPEAFNDFLGDEAELPRTTIWID